MVGVDYLIPARRCVSLFTEHAQFCVDENVGCIVACWHGPLTKFTRVQRGDWKVYGGINAGAKNQGQTRGWVNICPGKESRRRIIDNGI